jgi:hypothetical protein
MRKVPVEEFIRLLQSYLDHKIVTEEFTDKYSQLLKSYSTEASGNTQRIEEAYLKKQISLEEFQREFQKLVPDMMDPSLFEILEDLYEDVDSYSPTWTSKNFEDMPYLLDEQGLQNEVVAALGKLKTYQSTHET